jgi:hypothetical protein
MNLDELKKVRCKEIDLRTSELIEEGFVFDGRTFSMSINAQINWSNFPNLPEYVFPLVVIDKNDESYSLSLNNKLNFYLSALSFKNSKLQTGGALKIQINNCSDEESVLAVIDDRN